MDGLTVIAVLFFLSLFGAVILFKFFQSSAMIKGKTYQAGGAIAGFLILYGLMHWSYIQMGQNEHGKLTIKGNIIPSTVGPSEILLATQSRMVDNEGKFKLVLPCNSKKVDDMDLTLFYFKDGLTRRFMVDEENINNFTINLAQE